MSLVGSNPAPAITAVDELPGKSYYFIGNDPKGWHTDIPNYAQVEYDNVYAGVNLIYYGNQEQLEHDFVVAPGTNPQSIRIRFQGARALRIDGRGDLVLDVEKGQIRFLKPGIYQEVGGARQEIAGRYVVKSGNQVSFAVASYDPSRPLIIDPVLCYSTYLGDSGYDVGKSIAVDPSGNAYVTGNTSSVNFPTVNPLPAPNNALQGIANAFVSKLSFSGSTLTLVYSTYLGGSGFTAGAGIAVDSAGNAYVTGVTNSINLPTVNSLPAPNNALQGPSDAFVSKLSFSGSSLSLAYSTYLGGNGGDSGNAIAVDSSGNAYVTGATNSNNFPTVNSLPAPNNALQGSSDAFVSKLSFSGSSLSLAYSTYLGGNGLDAGAGIAVDSSGSTYVTGLTQSTNFPMVNSLPAPYNVLRSSFGNAFASKLTFSGSTLSLAYSTYLGGSGSEDDGDEGLGIAVDSAGNAYVAGFTESVNFPIVNSLAAPNNALQGITSAFVSKLSFSGSKLTLAYSTYLGGTSSDSGTGIAVDAYGNAYVTGGTSSADFPTVDALAAPNNTLQGLMNAFVSKLSFSGTSLSLGYSVYLGGSGFDGGTGIALDPAGNAYVTGATGSANFPTVNPLPPPNNALQSPSGNAFVAKLSQTPAELISGALNLVASFNLRHGLANSLSTQLTATQSALAAGNIATACSDINQFIGEVTAQSGKALTVSQAHLLLSLGNQIKVAIGC